MRGKWKGKVLLPMDQVVRATEGSLSRLASTFRKSHSFVSLGRRVDIFSIASPMRFTLKLREVGLIFMMGEERKETSLAFSQAEGSIPFLRSFVLELARQLPHPPWHREGEARRAALKTWTKMVAVSVLVLGLGLFNIFFISPSTLLELLLMITNIVVVIVPFVAIFMTHPDMVSRIQRRKWRRWIGRPELASMGWTERIT